MASLPPHPLHPAQPDTQKPGSIEHALQVLTNLHAHAQGKPFADRASTLRQCYDRVEEILANLLQHYKISFKSEKTPDGSHSYHDDLISKFADKNGPIPLYRNLGGGPIQGILLDMRKFRNAYKELKGGRKKESEVLPLLNSADGGFGIVIPALKKACQEAGILLNDLKN